MAIEEINISKCRSLTSLPDAIGDLPNLRILNASSSGLSSLNPAIRGAKALEKIDISSCGSLHSLPDAIDQLPNLTTLRVSWRYIHTIPTHFFYFPVIQNINYVEWIQACNDSGRIALAHTIYEGIKNIPNLPNTNYGQLSEQFLFAHELEGAVWAGERYVAVGGNYVGYLKNLAVGYLYNGQYDQAYTLYVKYRNELDFWGEIGNKIFLMDLEKKIIKSIPPKKPEDVARIRVFLHTPTFDAIEIKKITIMKATINYKAHFSRIFLLAQNQS